MDDGLDLHNKYALLGRLTSLSAEFDAISYGHIQVPSSPYIPSDEFTSQSVELAQYCSVYMRNLGTFWKHYCASIPYVLEEQCRVGLALARMARQWPFGSQLTFYETSSEDGTDARALAEFSAGRILTLTDGLHEVNEENFRRLCRHGYSSFFRGHFSQVTPTSIATGMYPKAFQQGFDVVYENATFQFYDVDRLEQIGHVRKLMNDDGIMICLEKLMHPRTDEYLQREASKDEFKSLYFDAADVAWKQANVLNAFTSYMVEFSTLVAALKMHFRHVALLWNSGNFYEVAATNSGARLDTLVSELEMPYVGRDLCYEGDLSSPRRL